MVITKKQLKETADRINSKRSAMNYTQAQFAERIGIATIFYTKIENAFEQPSLDTLMKIAKELNASMDFILYEERTKEFAVNDVLPTGNILKRTNCFMPALF